MSGEGAVMRNDAKTVARRWFEEVWNERRDGAIDELMAEGAYGHVEGGELRGPAEFRTMRNTFLNSLSDIRIEVEDVIAEDENAVVRWRARGTHDGPGFGVEATRRSIDIRGMTWLVVREGKIVEGWDTWNFAALLQTLGVPQPV